ncbi:MAG: Ig-like domain-containing protein [Micrococcales bacterium]|nr:Ig-like domain-containing protein [Micrococcales bacterium]MCL2666985.1 Ig-like domain-containing protein [Micrococcales bacterium]
MSARDERKERPVRRLRSGPVAALVVTLAVVVGAVVSQGYDAQETDRVESSVWVARDAGQYARVNTSLGQIDTVRSVDDPKQVVQHGSSAAIVAQNGRVLWPLDPATPADLAESRDQAGAVATPDDTEAVASAGRYVLYQTRGGTVWVGDLTAPQDLPGKLKPVDDEETQYSVTASTVNADGKIAVYSAGEGAVRVLDATKKSLVAGPVSISNAPDKDAAVSMAMVSGEWVLFDADAGRLWTAKHTSPVDLKLSELAKLQVSGGGSKVYLADGSKLLEVGVTSGDARTIIEAAGTPARPVVMDDGVVVAAWLSSGGGTMWTSDRSGTRQLKVDPSDVSADRQLNPVVVSNGDRAVLEETGTGLLWTVPDGVAIPLSQWSRIDQLTTQTGDEKDTPTEEEPPVAEPDSFGVRPGSHVRLPVLLNDHDPNPGDVLTIDPASVSELSDPGFGRLTLTNANQTLVVEVYATSGSATFTYQVTDGMMVSEPATVTLTVVPEGQNSEPQWCVEGCTQTWPAATLSPGGTAQVRVLDAWVDPEGDPFVLTSAEVADPAAPLRAVASADGSVTVQHTDPEGGATTAVVIVTVTDSNGAAAQRELHAVVTSAPNLKVDPIVLITGQDVPSTVVAADHVSSGSGSYRLVSADASAASADGLDLVARPDGTIIATPRQPGEFQGTYTVHDKVTETEASATVRVVCPDGPVQLSMAPMTAFVRGHQDTTVNVVSAVNATTSNVLVLTDVETAPVHVAEGYDATLMANVVDGSLLRLRGSTLDGQPGLVGTVLVTVSDGEFVTATGQISVFAVSDVIDPPIAVSDAVTVRAGAQVDIPVTDNDVAPGGAVLQVLPDSIIGSDAPGEMVFASGAVVRYVAPEQEGTYWLRYSVAPLGFPDAQATANIQVDVVPTGENRDPVPPPLVGRVPAGQSVQILVPRHGADPDGDPIDVVSVTQPPSGMGAAEVSDTLDAVIFQASESAANQQVSFTYQVRDTYGGLGTGTVRIAVSDADTNNAPIAYTDRVRLRQGDEEWAVLEPLLNDRDPAGGTLSITDVRPDAPGTEENPEWARLAELVDTSQMGDGLVPVRAGDELGTNAYVYTVRSSETGSTAEGLLVVEVTPSPSIDPPEVKDTVVTAARRAELARDGVDVVTGKVSWPSGDASTLTLELWNPDSRYAVSGGTIRGPAPNAGALVPFTLRGTDRMGREVVSHAFLRIPSFDDMRVSPDPNAKVVQVEEEGSVKIPLTNRVALAAGDRLEVDNPKSFAVQRHAASCVPAGGATVVYDAGAGEPWTDTCVVRVRLEGQTMWTDLVVPIQIKPKDAQPQLASTSRTIPPATSETIDLKSLTTWEGNRVGDESKLVYSADLVSDKFTMVQQGSKLTITAAASAVPGTRSTVTVTIAAFGGLRSTIDLVVGQAAPDTPRGATVSATCEASKVSCSVPLVGVSGEYDPFAGRPDGGLSLESVSNSCSLVSVSGSDKSATITWGSANKPTGGSCQVPFTVKDVQGRLGTGMLLLELPGFPTAPQLSLFDVDGSSVTFDVVTNVAYPAVAGVGLYAGATKVADCPASGGRCQVSGLTPGQERSYTARSRNSVGESADSNAISAWAYKAPEISIKVVPARAESTTQGWVTVTVTDSGNNTYKAGSVTTNQKEFELLLDVGNRTVDVIATSTLLPPPGVLKSPEGSASATVNVIGEPILTGSASFNVSGNTVTISGVDFNPNGGSMTEKVYVMSTSSGVTCDKAGNPVGGNVVQSSNTFTVEYNQDYWFAFCGSNGFGGGGGPIGSAGTVDKGAPGVTGSYSVAGGYSQNGNTYTYNSVNWNVTVTTTNGMRAVYSSSDGRTSENYSDMWTSYAPFGDISVMQCGTGSFQNDCSASAPIPRQGAPSTVMMTVDQSVSCDVHPFNSISPSSATGSAAPGPTSADGRKSWIWNWSAEYSSLQSIGPVYSSQDCRPPELPPEVPGGGAEQGGDEVGGP